MDESRSRSNSNKFCDGLVVWGSLVRGIKREWKEWRLVRTSPELALQQLTTCRGLQGSDDLS